MMFAPRPKGLGKDSFLKLQDKEEVTGMFRGDIYQFKRHWMNNRGVQCEGEKCQYCAADPKNFPSFRFRVNFITSKDGKYVAKIFESGGETYDFLSSLSKKYDLSKTVIDITRMGLNTNTKYMVMPRADVPVTKEFEAKIAAVELLALTTEGSESGE